MLLKTWAHRCDTPASLQPYILQSSPLQAWGVRLIQAVHSDAGRDEKAARLNGVLDEKLVAHG